MSIPWHVLISRCLTSGCTFTAPYCTRPLHCSLWLCRTTLPCCRYEYRVAHPPRIVCTHCGESFKSATELGFHTKDKKIHKEWDELQRENAERFKHVEALFVGAQKRRLLANRLLFSVDLAPMDERAKAAIHGEWVILFGVIFSPCRVSCGILIGIMQIYLGSGSLGASYTSCLSISFW